MRRALIYKFISMLKEGNIYCMGFFTVGSNDGDYRTTKHDFKLNFEINTVVEELKEPSITHSPYSFVPFNDMLEKEYDMSYLVGICFFIFNLFHLYWYCLSSTKSLACLQNVIYMQFYFFCRCYWIIHRCCK